ncbi:amidohydrolase [Treponema sp. TIM-1]|uniref:amidohydrolase family protein n=1 Tax=Treponema sp. TIM-1 TaxID=2898417 RepID=UPI003980C9EC
MENTIALFDFHCHIMESYTLYGDALFREPGLENAHQLTAYLENGMAEKLAVPAITLYTVPDLPCNPLALYAKLRAPGRIYALAGLRRGLTREDNAGMAAQARDLIAAGFDGFKLICKPNVRRSFRFAINDPLFDEFYAEAEKRSWPILFHVGDPPSFWQKDTVPPWAVRNGWYYGDDADIPSYRTLYEETFDVLRRYPTLPVTFAHFFFMADKLDQVPALLESYPRVCFDVTPGTEMYAAFSEQRDQARELFAAYGDRFLFGTDNTGCRGPARKDNLRTSRENIALMRRFFETDDTFDGFDYRLHGLALDKEILYKLYQQNFLRILGKEPAPVQRPQAAALCEAYRNLIAGGEPFAESTIRLLDELRHMFEN